MQNENSFYVIHNTAQKQLRHFKNDNVNTQIWKQNSEEQHFIVNLSVKTTKQTKQTALLMKKLTKNANLSIKSSLDTTRKT